jgi:transposase
MARHLSEDDVQQWIDAAVAEATRPLLARIAELETEVARLRKDSSNSSKPPSSDIVQPKTAQSKRKGRGRERKIGGQPGHPRQMRKPFGPDEIDQAYEYFCKACPDCGGELQNSRTPDRIVQQVELIEKPFVVSEHRARAQWCPRCRAVHRADLPRETLGAGLVGPRLTALVGYLKGACHVSYDKLREFFRDVLRLPISTGQLVKLTHKLTRALDPIYDALRQALPSQAQVGSDETGHKENGRRMWTWCMQTPGAEGFTFYAIDPSRGSGVLRAMLGEEFSGTLGCDFFSAYRKFQQETNVAVQYCWAHLIRDVRFLTTLPDQVTRNYGERLLEKMRRLFHDWHRRCDVSRSKANVQLRRRREELVATAKRPPPRGDARNIADRFRRHADDYFRFLDDWSIEPTNNGRERALRHVVIDRKITQGTRGESGRHWCERIWTTLATCRQQSRSPFDFLDQAITAHLANVEPPSLLPANP